MTDRSKNRSEAYQHLFAESLCAPEMIVEFSDKQGMRALLNIGSYKEELMDLKEQLVKAFWRIVDTQLTPRQKEVLHLCAQGKTQIEIAKLLNVNQSSITKSIHGNTDYRQVGKGKGKKVYGGAKKKIIRIVETDSEIQEIFRKMAELHAELDE